MRLTAYTIMGVYEEWEDVGWWKVDGPNLHLRFRGNARHAVRDVIPLPREVVGLADDSPTRPPAPSTEYYKNKKHLARADAPRSFRTALPPRDH